MRASNSTLSSVCTVCVCIKACTHLSLSVYSILHARLHSSQPVCRHRNTGQLSEYPPADTGTPPTSLIWLTSSHSPCPPPLVFSSCYLITLLRTRLHRAAGERDFPAHCQCRHGLKETSMLLRAKATMRSRYSYSHSTLSVSQSWNQWLSTTRILSALKVEM